MGKTKSKSSGKGFLSGLLAIIAIALGIVAVIFMMSPILTSSWEGTIPLIGTKISSTLDISGFTLAFGGQGQVTSTIGSQSSTGTMDFEMHVGALMMFIILLVGLVLTLAALLLKFCKVKGGIFKALAFVAFLCFLAAGVMFFCAQPICGDIAETHLKAGDYDLGTVDFREYLKLGYGAILSGICSIVAGISAAASAIVAK